MGAVIDVLAVGDATITGPMTLGPASLGNDLALQAGSIRIGAPITMSGALDSLVLQACTIDVEPGGAVALRGLPAGPEQRISASRAMTIAGDPLSSADYDLCFYTPSDTVGYLGANHGPAWTARGTRGFRYLDQSAPEGTTRLKLLAGEAGRSSIELKGRAGASRLPIETPLTVQLQAGNGACWTSPFSAPSTNLSHRSAARSD
jgi:hypothetical protein